MYSDINERSGVSVAIHGHTLYVFGGRTDDETAMNDLSTFDLLTVEWKRLTTNGGFFLDQSFLYAAGQQCQFFAESSVA